jgi:2,4-dienoyl-CoA reductase (NADPH2)
LFEAGAQIGGQFLLAAKVPGKEDYGLSIVGFQRQLDAAGVEVRTGSHVSSDALGRENFDAVIIATGVHPRPLDIPGANDPRVVGYNHILDGSVQAGARVVVIGGGGVGHDVALYLASGEKNERQSVTEFEARWGINGEREAHSSRRRVVMVKRSSGPFGRTLGKSTGWILRQELKSLGVRQISEASYLKIDGEGLYISVAGVVEVVPADTIVVCAGQLSNRTLADELQSRDQAVHVIGGARFAGELDAERAIFEGAMTGNQI